MQWLRLGDYVGVRYDIKSADDDFEIYNVDTDLSQHHNLASGTGKELPLALPASSGNAQKTGVTVEAFQSFLKSKVLQMHRPNSSAPRPYDSAFIPSLKERMCYRVLNGKFIKVCFHGSRR